MTLKKSLFYFVFLFLCGASLIASDTENAEFEKSSSAGIKVDLRNPEYSQGVLSTEEGGVIEAPNLRIQAGRIKYTHTPDNISVEAEENLMIHYGQYVLVGDRIIFDFRNNTGILINGRSGVSPWYFGGEVIELNPEGDLVVLKGFATTSENICRDWGINTNYIRMDSRRNIFAKDLYFRFGQVPILWAPRLKTNLDSIFDSPLRYRVRCGGEQGTRLGIVYELFKWDGWSSFLRFDYRVKRGPGGGLETYYTTPCGKQYLKMINYAANDPSIENPNILTRYRFQGIFHDSSNNGRFTTDLCYDKLSDRYMATDYYDKGLDLHTAGLTRLNIRRQAGQSLIANFSSQVRINDFQTLKQELPSLSISLHPVNLWNTGLILESTAKAEFLDFQYGKYVPGSHGSFHSSRLDWQAKTYRMSRFGPAIFTPEASFHTIWYDQGTQGNAQSLIFGVLGAELKAPLHRNFPFGRHSIEPYAQYTWITRPTSLPNQHYVFDITDGWYDLNSIRFGTRNFIFSKDRWNSPYRYLHTDTYAYAFLNSSTIPVTVPKIYTDIVWNIYPTLRQTTQFGYDLQRGMIDHYNLRTEWTINENFALSTEYRHRSAYAWRKANFDNFILENYQPESFLRDSPLSDRRNTLLGKAFLRLNEMISLQFQIRHGWNRSQSRSYTESQADLFLTLRSAWNLRVSYRNRENEHHRFAMNISLGVNKP